MSDAPIALSCGEPAGIGPEIAAKAWATLRAEVPFLWIGDPRHLPDGTPFEVLGTPENARHTAEYALPVWPVDFAAPAQPGQLNPANATGVITAIETGVALVQSGAAQALCTAPIHKKALKDGADFPFPGHTEFLAHLAGVENVVMMLACDALKVVPATIHIPLSEVPATLTQALLTEVITLTDAGLKRDFGIEHPRIAVSGLNPHAGEGGAMGTEDAEVIAPVLHALRQRGLDLRGPMPADTMFHASARAGYDAAVCMYHDQALIPIKTVDFAGGVNVTLGLPFVRTSPDHGTALDIAGQDRADPTSLLAALRMASRMAKSREA